MAYSAKILADSVNAYTGKRLTTFEITYPRFVHSEVMTHRVFSRNSASSRAIPIKKMLEQIENDPAMPVWWGKNQAGMQAREELTGQDRENAIQSWLAARDAAVEYVRHLEATGVHKQIVNRVVEPWMFITVLVSATEWDNFFKLRCHEDAQPEIRHVAVMMKELYDDPNHTPQVLGLGDWHLPLMPDLFDLQVQGVPVEDLCRISVGRSARVSYLTHNGVRDIQADIDLCNRLAAAGHMSPFEHVAEAISSNTRCGNFLGGWMQYRPHVDKDFLW